MSQSVLISQEHISDLHRIALRAIISPQGLPNVFLVNPFQLTGKLVYVNYLDPNKAINNLEVQGFGQ